MEFLEEMEFVGDTPEDWKCVKLGEIADIKMGQSPESKYYNDKGIGLPFLQGSKTFGYKYPEVEMYCSNPIKVARKGEILISVRAPVGDINIATQDICIGRGIASINSLFNQNEFLFYYLKHSKNDLLASETGTVFGSINKETLYNFPILLPPLPKQKAIAEVLSSIDDKIELLHRQNKTLEEMAMTLFKQWFIESTKDGLPDGWEEVNLGEIIEISSGKSIEKGKLKEKGLYPVLGANGEIGRTDDWLYEGELIYTGRVGTLGNVFIVFENEKVWLTDNTLIIKPKKNEYYYFVYFTLKNAKLDEYNSGSTQPLIRQSDIKEIEIFLPKINHLKDFEVISRNIFTKIQFNTSQIQTLEKLRDTLLPKLMSGEIRVKI
ncbi:MAG: restriction endonuclease subunit S [Sulfurihydrogenibium sp.]|nr:restriction endonuclease subunit S [Sulfurihydrogenibium sp.]